MWRLLLIPIAMFSVYFSVYLGLRASGIIYCGLASSESTKIYYMADFEDEKTREGVIGVFFPAIYFNGYWVWLTNKYVRSNPFTLYYLNRPHLLH